MPAEPQGEREWPGRAAMSAEVSQEGREARVEKRDRERQRRENERADQVAANRVRRGNPQRFTLTGVKLYGAGTEDFCWTMEEVDPPLERDEVVEVVEVAALTAALERLAVAEAERDEAREQRDEWKAEYAAVRG